MTITGSSVFLSLKVHDALQTTLDEKSDLDQININENFTAKLWRKSKIASVACRIRIVSRRIWAEGVKTYFQTESLELEMSSC
jgi:hypothetical protein